MKFKFLIIIYFISLSIFSQSKFLPDTVSYFNKIILDPIESQVFGSLVSRNDFFNKESSVYVPFAIGGSRVLWKWDKSVFKYELSVDYGAYTQFEFVIVDNVWQRNLLNSDFKIGLPFTVVLNNKNDIRIRLYHLSSHEGDDYIFRNSITSYRKNPVNYEQLDVFFSHKFLNKRLYFGIGFNPRPETIRKRFSTQLGLHSLNNKNNKFFYGFDLKIFEQNNFEPNWKFGIGYSFGKIKPIYMMIEYYNGHLPYSMYERIRTEMIGLGLYMLLNN